MSKVSVLNIYAKIFLKLPETIDYVSFFLILTIWLMYSLSFLLLGEIGLKLPKDPLCSLVSYYICVLSKQWGVFGAFFAEKNASSCEENGSEENNKSETKQHTCEGSV